MGLKICGSIGFAWTSKLWGLAFSGFDCRSQYDPLLMMVTMMMMVPTMSFRNSRP